MAMEQRTVADADAVGKESRDEILKAAAELFME